MHSNQAAHKVVENKRLIKATGIVSLATLVSRILGFARDTVTAFLFGAGSSADAFFVAFRIPNMLRQLLAEGSLSASFIPVFTEYMTQKGERSAWELASAAICVLGVVLLAVSALGILLAPAVVSVMAPGYKDIADKLQLTINLTRLMFPYIFCVGLAALFMGMLNSMHHFLSPALSPALLNIFIIATTLVLSPRLDQPVYSLAIGVLLGGLAQLMIQVPFLKKHGLVFTPKFDFGHPGIRRIGKLMLPAAFGLAVAEINVLVDTLMASYLANGSVSWLYYANRLVQFPMGLFGIAIGTAVLPAFSRMVAEDKFHQLKETFSFAMRTALFLSVPAMVGLIALREPIVNLLFQHGKFSYADTVATSQAVMFYGLGMCAYTAVKIIVPVFYSLQDTKTPVRTAAVAMLVNIPMNLLLIGPLKHGGLALATALSSTLNVALLIIALRKRVGLMGGRKILAALGKILVAAAALGVVGSAVITFGNFMHQATIVKFLLLGLSVVLGVSAFLLVSHWQKSEELGTLRDMFAGRTKKSVEA